jgi:hypothetical protein
MQQPYLFISHASADTEYTEFIATRLEDAGYRCWVDVSSIADGSTWTREIEKGVRECGALVVILSQAALQSDWVENEVLMAAKLKKPIFIALFEDVTLPIYLINRQYSDFRRRREAGMKKLLAGLGGVSLTEPVSLNKTQQKKLSANPNELNFFRYLEKAHGAENARIAREIFAFATEYADNVSFSGRKEPAFHAHVYVGPGGVLVFSLRAYRRQPAVEIPLGYFVEFPPYDDRRARLDVIRSLNALLPAGIDPFDDARADRKPNVPLIPALADAESLAAFRAVLTGIIDHLRLISGS